MALHIPAQIYFYRALAFLAAWTISLYSSQATCPCFCSSPNPSFRTCLIMQKLTSPLPPPPALLGGAKWFFQWIAAVTDLVVLIQKHVPLQKVSLKPQALVKSGDYHGILNYIVMLQSLSIFIRFTKLNRMTTALISTWCF